MSPSSYQRLKVENGVSERTLVGFGPEIMISNFVTIVDSP